MNTIRLITQRAVPAAGLPLATFLAIYLASGLLASAQDCQCNAFAQIEASGNDNQGLPANCTFLQFSGECYSTNYDSANNLPFVTKCSPAKVYLGAGACSYGGTGTATITYTINKGTCQVVSNAPNTYTISVEDWDKAGSITFKADASGECYPSGTMEAHKQITIAFDPGAKCGCSQNTGPGGSFGSGMGLNDSVNFFVSLGLRESGGSAGKLEVFAEEPSTNLAQAAGLSLAYASPDVTVITNSSGVILQVKTAQGLFVTTNLSSYSYQLMCFDSNNITGYSSGLYNYSGSPLVTWLVQNPDGATASNQVWFSEIRSGATNRVFKYCHTNGGWNLLQPDGTTLERTFMTGSGTISNKVWQLFSGSQLVSCRTNTFQYLTGFTRPLLMQESEGTGAALQTTTYTYYGSDPTNGARQNLVKRIDRSGGGWSYFIYDDYGHVLTNYEAYLSNPAPSTNSIPDPSVIGCKVTAYSYADPGDVNPWAPRTTTVLLPVYNGSTWDLTPVSDVQETYNQSTDPTYGNNLLTRTTYHNTTAGQLIEQEQTYVLAARQRTVLFVKVAKEAYPMADHHGYQQASAHAPQPTERWVRGLARDGRCHRPQSQKCQK